MASRLPSSSKNTFALIDEIIDMGTIEIPPKFKGAGAPGNTLEYLLNVNQNNFDSPDFRDWEIKFHGGGSLLTLFHKDPQPRGIMNKFVDAFGWPNDSGQLSLRHTMSGSSERGFNIDNVENKITIINSNNPSIVAYWDHNTILNSMGAKLRRLIVVHGKVDKVKRLVIYKNAVAYWDLKLSEVCEAIRKGIIYIDFDARTKYGRGTTLRNHGTKFRVPIKDIGLLYENSQVIK